MKRFPLQEYSSECPECEGTEQLVEGTEAEFTGDDTKDNTTIISWWECLDCGHKELELQQ